MKIRFEEEQIKKIVEYYYKEYEEFDGKLTFKSYMKEAPFGFVALVKDYIPIVDFTLNGSIKVAGENYPVTVPISECNVCNAFKVVLGDQGYSVKRVMVDCAGDDGTKKAQFNGVIVDMSTKTKVK